MTNYELIDKHRGDCGLWSMAGQMRNHSSSYKEIIDKGEEIIPDILEYLEKEEEGMSILILLMDITKEMPYKPKEIEGTQMASWNIKEAREVWIEWGKNKKELNFYLEEFKKNKIECLKTIHYKCREYLDKKDYSGVKKFINLFKQENVDVNILHTILILIRSLEENEELKDFIAELKDIFNKKINTSENIL